MTDNGFVYLLKNECMPGYYKIGLTRSSVESRIKTLRSTSLPKDFECIESFESDFVLQLERHIHKRLKEKRAGKDREFFIFHSEELAVDAFRGALKAFNPKAYSKNDIAKIEATKENAPAQQAKAEGLKSLSQVSEMTGQSLQTLSNWAKNKPELFKIVLLGCKAKLATPASCRNS